MKVISFVKLPSTTDFIHWGNIKRQEWKCCPCMYWIMQYIKALILGILLVYGTLFPLFQPFCSTHRAIYRTSSTKVRYSCLCITIVCWIANGQGNRHISTYINCVWILKETMVKRNKMIREIKVLNSICKQKSVTL